jgi:filamentous hemagglutinin
MSTMQICSSTDCSEIAGRPHDAAGTGSVLRVEPAAPGTLQVLENGAVEGGMTYHEAFTDRRYVFDPRMSPTPIPKGDWTRVMRGLNPGGRIR